MENLEKRYNNISLDIDNIEEKDYLNNIIYVNELENMIKNFLVSDKKEPFYIALTGSWGSGKTTLLKTYENRVHKNNKNDIKIIWYDAWKYEGNSFKRDFVRKVLDESRIKKNGIKYKNRLHKLYHDKVYPNLFSKYFIILLLLLFIITLFLVYVYCRIKGETSIASIIIESIKVLLGSEIIAITLSSVSYTEEKLFSSEQFYDIVKDILDRDIKEKNIIIIIDNIDRCTNDDFKKTLNAFKGFYDMKIKNRKVIYVMPFDKNQFYETYKKENNDILNDYYEKIFDISIDIKNTTIKNTINFLNKLIDNNKDYYKLFTIEVKSILSKSNITNPRKIINLCNSYINEYNLFRIRNKSINKINHNHLNYLMKYTVLKVCFSDFFDEIHNHLYLFMNTENSIGKIERSSSFHNATDEVKDFLKRTVDILPENYDYYYLNIDENKFESEIDDYITEKPYNYNAADKIVRNNKENFLNYIGNNLMYYNAINNKKYDFYYNANNLNDNIIPIIEYIIHLVNKKIISANLIKEKINFMLKESEFIKDIFVNQKIESDDIINLLSQFKSNKRVNKNILDIVTKYCPDNTKNYQLALIYAKLDLGKLSLKQINDFNLFIDNIIENKKYINKPYSDILLSDITIYMTEKECIDILKNVKDNISIIENIIICIYNICNNYTKIKNKEFNINELRDEFADFIVELLDSSYKINKIKSILKKHNEEINKILPRRQRQVISLLINDEVKTRNNKSNLKIQS